MHLLRALLLLTVAALGSRIPADLRCDEHHISGESCGRPRALSPLCVDCIPSQNSKGEKDVPSDYSDNPEINPDILFILLVIPIFCIFIAFCCIPPNRRRKKKKKNQTGNDNSGDGGDFNDGGSIGEYSFASDYPGECCGGGGDYGDGGSGGSGGGGSGGS